VKRDDATELVEAFNEVGNQADFEERLRVLLDNEDAAEKDLIKRLRMTVAELNESYNL
jgi:hypothetical protein